MKNKHWATMELSPVALKIINSGDGRVRDICKVIAYLLRTRNPSGKRRGLRGIDIWDCFTSKGQDLSKLLEIWDEYKYLYGDEGTRDKIRVKYAPFLEETGSDMGL